MKIVFLILCCFSSCGRSHAFIKEVQAELYEIKNYPLFPYPAHEMVQKIGRDERLTIFVYGSLMNPLSAKKQLSQRTIDTMRLAIALGCKRLFNRDVPLNPEIDQENDPIHRGMLNIQRTGNIADFTNGILLDIAANELEALIQREVGYDLLPVIVMDWEKSLKGVGSYKIVYAFSAAAGSKYTSKNILPNKRYATLCEDAAKAQGDLFFYLWLQTTYLSDEKTNLVKLQFLSKKDD